MLSGSGGHASTCKKSNNRKKVPWHKVVAWTYDVRAPGACMVFAKSLDVPGSLEFCRVVPQAGGLQAASREDVCSQPIVATDKGHLMMGKEVQNIWPEDPNISMRVDMLEICRLQSAADNRGRLKRLLKRSSQLSHFTYAHRAVLS